MKVIKPTTITDANLVSSSVPETEYAAYAAGTNYAVGASVIYNHVVYQSVQTPNTGNTPDSKPLYWAASGPSNRYGMFDSQVSTVTTASGSITVVLTPGLVTSLALFNLAGNQVTVEVRDGAGGTVVYSYTTRLDASTVSDWYQYFYTPFLPTTQVVLTDLPLYGSAYITVTITGISTVMCGLLIVGQSTYLGDTQQGAQVGILSLSRKDTSVTTGVTTFVKRGNRKRLTAQLFISNYDLDAIFRTLELLDATPAVWVATDVAGYQTLSFYGFYKDYSTVISYPDNSLISLEIEGLI